MPTEPRIVVLGGGIAGAATAFGLIRRGAMVTVVDAGLPGQATAAGAGIVQPWSTDREGEFASWYAEGAEFYPELLSRLTGLGAGDIGYRRNGSLIVDTDAEVLAAIAERVARRSAGSVVAGQLRMLTPAEARQHFPPLADGLAAVWVSGGARVDGRLLRDALLAAVRQLGGSVVTGRGELDGAQVSVDQHVLPADAVVVAAGAWTPQLLARQQVSVPVQPQRGQIVHLHVDADTSGWPSVVPPGDHYLVAFDHGRVAVGATRESGTGLDARITAGGIRSVLDKAIAVAPGLAEATVGEIRVGLRPLPTTDLPVLGSLPGLPPNVFVCTGFGAAGLTMGPLLGDRLARQILDN